MFEASVILSTYNSAEWLRKSLLSLESQTADNFEVIVADDGSGSETGQLIASIDRSGSLALRHVWHEDRGFRKTEILNKAVLASRSNYLIFSDGDCVFRQDFVETHLRLRRPRAFLSGGYYKLGRQLSQQISGEDIARQRCFDLRWLRRNGHPANRIKDLKLTQQYWLARALNAITPTHPTWNGHNASTWKEHIVAANGFDTRMKYGGEDREFGVRLKNAGINAVQIRYSAICVHLDHDRGYVTPDMVAENRRIWDTSINEKLTTTPFGLDAR